MDREPPPRASVRIELDGPADVQGFRREARRLMRERVPPDAVVWLDGLQAAPMAASSGSLWEAEQGEGQVVAGDSAPPSLSPATPTLRVPAEFVTLCEQALLHSDPGRFVLMYRLLWRLIHEPGLRDDPLDDDRLQAQRLAREVRRDIHKMRAFVRFTDVGDGRHVAWFEPSHHILEANVDFFRRRFAGMRWAILTPRRCVEWDGTAVSWGPGADRRSKPPADAGEGLWLTYYQHIFNPARLKLAMMTREMPRRYWNNLPEAELIKPLADAAATRSARMVAAEPTAQRRIRAPGGLPVRVAEAGAPASLDQLRLATNACRECPIGAQATQAVIGDGCLHPPFMLVGEQPGDQEDLQGRAFVGPAGRLLDQTLLELGWPRDRLYVANAVKHFKFELRGKRRIHKTATQREAAACLHWLEDEIALVKPQRLIALGATAARALLGRAVGVMAERGAWLHERVDAVPVFVTLHPSALLRQAEDQRDEMLTRWVDEMRRALCK